MKKAPLAIICDTSAYLTYLLIFLDYRSATPLLHAQLESSRVTPKEVNNKKEGFLSNVIWIASISKLLNQNESTIYVR